SAIGINVFLVAEGDRFERKDRFARLVHRLDLGLETRRRSGGAELAFGVYENGRTHRSGFPHDASDIGGGVDRMGRPLLSVAATRLPMRMVFASPAPPKFPT